MAAGVHYAGSPFEVEKELYQVKTGYRMAGGYNPTSATLTKYNGVELPTLTPLKINTSAHTFEVISNFKVYEAAEASATTLKICKKSLVQVGEKYILADGSVVSISAIDKSNAGYDALTVSALSAAVALGAVAALAEQSKKKAVVAINAAQNATTVYVNKGHGLEKGVTLTDGTNDVVVSNIVFGSDVDALTVTALSAALSAEAELEEKVKSTHAVASANAMLYAKTKMESGVSVTALGKAFEIEEAELYIPVTEADKKSLGALFMFI